MPTVAGAVQAFDLFPISSPGKDFPRDALPHSVIITHIENRPLFLDAAGKLQDSVPVESEFDSLEEKVAQFVGICERLRAENIDLRQQLAAAQNDAKRLNDKIEGAKSRLEQLLQRIPG